MCDASASPDADYGHFTSPLRRYADLHNQVVRWLARERQRRHEGASKAFSSLNLRTRELVQTYYYADADEGLAWDNAHLMHAWLRTRDLRRVCAEGGLDGVWQAGAFVRMVLRDLSFMEEMDGALLGLHRHSTHERLRADRHARMICGVVTNASLYTVGPGYIATVFNHLTVHLHRRVRHSISHLFRYYVLRAPRGRIDIHKGTLETR